MTFFVCAVDPNTAKKWPICLWAWLSVGKGVSLFFSPRNLTVYTIGFLNLRWPCLWKIGKLFSRNNAVVCISIKSLSLMTTKSKQKVKMRMVPEDSSFVLPPVHHSQITAEAHAGHWNSCFNFLEMCFLLERWSY